MKYTEEELKQADLEIQKLIESGKYKQLGFEVVNSINNIELSDKCINMCEYTLELYLEYMEALFNLDENTRLNYLQTLKTEDIINNQKLEKEDSFLLTLSLNLSKKHAIDLLLQNKITNFKELITIYETLMKNTSSEHKVNKGFRNNNRKYVGEIVDGQRIIQYFPLDYKNIEKVMNIILQFYNEKSNKYSELLFIKPIIVHGLIAAYQPFDDGNTRFARLLQHVKIFDLSNEKTDYKLDLPSLYCSKTYYPYRQEYRNLIKKIVLSADSNSWNEWIIFNLKRFQEAIYYNMNKIEEINNLNNNKKTK